MGEEKKTFLQRIRDAAGIKTRAITGVAAPLVIPASEAVEVVETYQQPQQQNDIATLAVEDFSHVKKLKQSLNQASSQTDPHKPRIKSAGILTPDMKGVRRGDDGVLYVSYTFERNSNVDGYLADTTDTVPYKDYEQLNESEKQRALHSMKQYETANIVFEEASNPDEAYFVFANFDMSNQKVTHDGVVQGVGGTCQFPRQDGAVVAMNKYYGSDLDEYEETLVHELGHGFGKMHPHDSRWLNHLDSENTTQMAYSSRHQAEGHIGGISPESKYGSVKTLQALDLEYMHYHYGKAERPAKVHVIDTNKFLGTLEIRADDTLKIVGEGEGLIDLRGRLENPMLMDSSKVWLTNPPRNIDIENGDDKMVLMANNAAQLNIESGDAVIAAGAGSRIKMGDGQEMVALPEANTTIMIEDFDPANDILAYGENVTRHELEPYGDNGSYMTFFEAEKRSASVIFPDLTPEQIATANLVQVNDGHIEAIVNRRRPFINLEFGDNGKIDGFAKSFHAVQLNSEAVLPYLTFEAVHEAGKTKIGIGNKDITGVFKAESHYEVDGIQNPSELDIYANGKKVQCSKGDFCHPDGSLDMWREAASDGWPKLFTDLRSTENSENYQVKTNHTVIAGSTSRRFFVNETDKSHIQFPDSTNIDLLLGNAGVVSINRFDTAKDTLTSFNNELDVLEINEDGMVVVIGRESSGSSYGEKYESYMLIKNLSGNIDDLGANVNKIEASELTPKDYSIFSNLYDNMQEAEIDIKEVFPDVDLDGKTKPAAAPAKSGRGR